MDDPSPNRRTTAFDICHSLWPGFGRATTRAHPASAPGLWKQCTRSVLCSQYVLFPYRKCPLGGLSTRTIKGKRQTRRKRLKKQTPRLGVRRKSWEVSQREAAVYTKFMALSLAPSIKYFVA